MYLIKIKEKKHNIVKSKNYTKIFLRVLPFEQKKGKETQYINKIHKYVKNDK